MSDIEELSPPLGSKIESGLDRRENISLRWIVGGLLSLLGVVCMIGGTIGQTVWSKTSTQVDRNTEDLRKHELSLQELRLDAAARDRENTARMAAIQAWLQAIGQRLNVQNPPPGIMP